MIDIYAHFHNVSLICTATKEIHQILSLAVAVIDNKNNLIFFNHLFRWKNVFERYQNMYLAESVKSTFKASF